MSLKDQDLEVVWRYEKNKVKRYGIVCTCGNNKLQINANNVSCNNCGKQHTHDNFIRMNEKQEKLSTGREKLSGIRQWIPPKPRQTIVVSKIKGLAQKLNVDYQKLIAKLPVKRFKLICEMCKGQVEYGDDIRRAGFSTPLMAFRNYKNVCFPCIRKALKTSREK